VPPFIGLSSIVYLASSLDMPTTLGTFPFRSSRVCATKCIFARESPAYSHVCFLHLRVTRESNGKVFGPKPPFLPRNMRMNFPL
jgi:hypothetical protein